MPRAYLVALGYATVQQRNAVQAKVKEHALGWWHEMPDVWIVGGQSHKFWADLLGPLVTGTTARLLVLQLPDEQNHRMFAVRNTPVEANKWLWETYFDRPFPPSTPSGG
jgi:hypothetical protein